MPTTEETAVFMAEMRKDILYIKQMFEDKCEVYDKHVDEGQGVRDRLRTLEDNTKGITEERISNIEKFMVRWVAIWATISGGIVLLVTLLTAFVHLMGFIK